MFLEPSSSSAESSLSSIPDRIPLFPLPNVVFFPKTYLPLHVFEPRYRQMVLDATAFGKCIGMALLKEGWQDDYYGHPPVYELGCVGRIISIQNLADGRSNIVLQGLCRYKILDEDVDRAPYRQALIARSEEQPSESLLPSVRADFMGLFKESISHQAGEPAWEKIHASDVSDEVLINTLSTLLDFTPLERQLLLEADTILQRARRLSDLLHFKRYERHDRKGRG